MKVMICGGGTGGHIYPALAVIDELIAMGMKRNDLLWLGTHGQMEERLVPAFNLNLATLPGGPVVGGPVWTTALNLAKLAWSMVAANRHVSRFKPDVLFMTGGYINVPVALVARMRKVPAMTYLPDVEPGSAIKFISRFVDVIATTTKASDAYFEADKTRLTGYPVRSTLRQALTMSKVEALARFDLEPERPTLFVFGGSRGAKSINQALMRILPQLLTTAQVIHISGNLTWPEVAAYVEKMPASQQQYYRPFAYLDDEMGAAFRAADLVVARSGASMLGECPAFAVPAILVPYPHAWRYQKVNADYLTARGAAVHLADDNMATKLLPTVVELLHNPEKLGEMSAAAKLLDQPQAAKKLAHLLQELA